MVYSCDIPIVFVWIGKSLPFYCLDSLFFARYFNSKRPIHLVLSESTTLSRNELDFILFHDIQYFRYATPIGSSLWFNAYQRFPLLYYHALSQNSHTFVHAELDNIVFPVTYLDDYIRSHCQLFLPYDSHGRGFGSFFICNNIDSLKLLSSYDPAKFNSTYNEMFLLGELLSNSTLFSPLPTFGSTPLKTLSNSCPAAHVFDAAFIGQFFFGTDVRCKRFITKNLFINETYDYDTIPSGLTVSQDGLLLYIDDIALPVANIHLHSKNFRLFQSFAEDFNHPIRSAKSYVIGFKFFLNYFLLFS